MRKTNLPILPYMCFGLVYIERVCFCFEAPFASFCLLSSDSIAKVFFGRNRCAFFCFLLLFMLIFHIIFYWLSCGTVQLLSHETRFIVLLRSNFFAVGFCVHLSKNALYTNYLLTSLLFAMYKFSVSKNDFIHRQRNFFITDMDNGPTYSMDKI